MFLKLLYDNFMTAYVTVFVLQIMYCCILSEIKYVALCGRSQYSVDQMPLFAREEIRVFFGGGAEESELCTTMHRYILAKLIP